MVNVRKPIFENPVYGQILIFLSNRPAYVGDILEMFDIKARMNFDKNSKTQPILREQLLTLKEENYVIEVIPTTKHRPGNKIIYKVNFSKIVEEFIRYAAKWLNDKNDPYDRSREMKDATIGQQIQELLSKIDDYKQSKLLQDWMRAVLNEHRSSTSDSRISLSDISDYLLTSDFLGRMENELKSIDLQAFLKQRYGTIDYDLLVDFCNEAGIPFSNRYYRGVISWLKNLDTLKDS